MRMNRLPLLAVLACTALLLTACDPDKPEPPKAATAAPTAANPAPPTAGPNQDLNRAIQEPLDKARAVEDTVMEGQEAQSEEIDKQGQQ